jgi:hypothetical protein
MQQLYQPYQPLELKSAVQKQLAFDEAFFKEGYQCVVWHMSEVKYFSDQTAALEYFKNEGNYILRIRIFNQQEEYHFWRSGGLLSGRLRTDATTADGDVYAIETEMVLRGVIAKQITVAGKETFFIKTRNYIATDGFGYNDSRFVEIIGK